MRILLPSDVFPPRCGGAGWSSYHLARALRGRGHQVLVVVPVEGQRGRSRRSLDGLPVLEWGYRAPALPFVRNLFRNELLWPRLARSLLELARSEHYEILHAQHSLTIPAAVLAGRRLSIPVVATVRDYWPLCYRATLLSDDGRPCQRCDLAAALRCLGRGPLSALLLPLYPYVRANLRRKARSLARADAVVAVSQYLAGRLADVVPPPRLHALPNLVDLEEIDRIVAAEPETPLDGPFMLFVGKLESNKGPRELVAALGQLAAQLPPERRIPLLLAGSGRLQPWIEAELAALGWPARFLRWAGHDEVLRLLARAELLLFPSRWQEPLSRVLLEACACGAPILAMATGGTPEIVQDGLNGALVPPQEAAFARRLGELLQDPEQRRRLGRGARRTAEERYAAPVVAARVEALYQSLVEPGP
ncbi:MAG: glycosyltransferase family 4 protein [Chloroflexia bacterium]|nr:glycosyltransferase family 4 protein [Chloroflexia bacterium]